MHNQWLIRTPAKSFFVSAASPEEKRAWIENIESCQASLSLGTLHRPAPAFADVWIPDSTSERCLRCFTKFTVTTRRHHCRKCGFLVCDSCSKHKAVIRHISPTQKKRVCKLCHDEVEKKEEDMSRMKWDSSGKSCSEGEDETTPDEFSQMLNTPSPWLDTWMIFSPSSFNSCP